MICPGCDLFIDHNNGEIRACPGCGHLFPDDPRYGRRSPTEEDLQGRVAKCTYCKNEINSHLNAPFFIYKPKEDKDEYYCGCQGWD